MSQRASSALPRALYGQPLVAFGATAVLGSLAPRAPVPCLLLTLIWLGCWVRGARLAAVCLLVFGLCGVLAEGARSQYRREWSAHAERFAGLHRCALRGSIISSPTARRSLTVQNGLDESFLLLVRAGTCGERALAPGTRVRLSRNGATAGARGDELDVLADLGPVRLFRNAALSDPFDGAARHGAVLGGRVLSEELLARGSGPAALIDRARAQVRRRIVATYAPGAVALGRALVLGESDLDPEDGDAFRKSGLMHLLAVSGTHLVIAVLALVEGMRALLVRVGPLARRFDSARISALLGAILSGVYADFAGGSGSAWRAAYMLGLVLGARALGLHLAGGSALGASLLVGLLVDPLVGADVSFLLSALATAGLIGIGQPLGARLTWGPLTRLPWKPIVSSLVATFAATIACAPVLALMDGRMTLSALLANVVAGPLGEMLALPACLLHTVAAFWPPLEGGLSQVGSGALLLVRVIALWSARQEAVAFVLGMPDAWQCAGVTAAFVAWPRLQACLRTLTWPRGVWASVARLLLLLGAFAALLGLGSGARSAALLRGGAARAPRLAVTALDVGQGDALVVDFPDGRLALVDGGGFATGVPDTGQRVVLPYLRARGRRVVDLMILSHAHPDHLLGLASVAEALPVRELWLTSSEKVGGPDLARLLRAVGRAGGKVRSARELCPERATQEIREFGGATVSVFLPCDAEEAWRELGENDRSLVVHVRYGSRSVLLSGDIEREGERRLVERHGPELRADLLKVPHHGSDTSSGAELLRAVAPHVALISCGVRNRFEHPRPSVLERLEGAGVRTLRTDRLGSISWLTDGERFWLRGFAEASPAPIASSRGLPAGRAIRGTVNTGSLSP